MEIPSFKEDLISPIPALQMLVNWGYMCLINRNLHDKPEDFIWQNQLYRHGI